jgi:putative aminopeptidase FrvX
MLGDNMKKGFVIIGLIVFIGVSLVGGVNPSPAFADAVWIEGKVTERYSTGQVHHIQLDDKKHYMLMKNCRIDMRFRDRPGAFIEKPVDFGYIRKGQRVTIKAEDNRAYQILILE